MTASFHRRYLDLVDEIEGNFPVERWRRDDVDIWPLARMELYLDMYWQHAGVSRPRPRPFPFRSIARIARPLRNLWRSRADIEHFAWSPRQAHAIFLGDGVSLDLVDGLWQDRFGEPLMAALEGRGLATFLMQSGDLTRLPWRRRTYAANLIATRGHRPIFDTALPSELPGHDEVLLFLECNNVRAQSMTRGHLEKTTSVVAASAVEFERILRIVNPTLAFVVTYYAGLGPAFLLACRRQGVLSIDLQHCPQEGAHKAYGWSALPERGYASLPAVFWNWTASDAAVIRRWTDTLANPWHRSMHGGHTQLAPYLNATACSNTGADWPLNAVTGGVEFEREILIALQPLAGHRPLWDTVVSQIRKAPPRWRWWIRRHPASTRSQDAEYASLLALSGHNVLISEASSTPLPALLKHVSILVSLASGAAVEAALFGVPAVFLSEQARGQFSNLIVRGEASVIDPHTLNATIAATPKRPPAASEIRMPNIDEGLSYLESIAQDYSRLCQMH